MYKLKEIELSLVNDPSVRTEPDLQRLEAVHRCKSLQDYHEHLAEKYDRAVRQPWALLPSDPPPPAEPDW